MRTMFYRSATVLALAGSVAVLTPLSARAAAYSLTWLGSLPGGSVFSEAADVNDAGQVVGRAATADGQRAFLWDAENGMIDLGLVAGQPAHFFSYATGINEAGQVTGSSGGEAFVWDDVSGMQGLGVHPDDNTSRGTAINDAGQVAGYGELSFDRSPLSWSASGAMTEIFTTMAADGAGAADINNAGQIVGDVYESISPLESDAYVWSASEGLTLLGRLPGASFSRAFAINDLGQVVGRSGASFIWDEMSGFTVLADLAGGADSAAALDINTAGVAVGEGYDADGRKAVIWSAGAVASDLNAMISGGGLLKSALAISDAGYIVGVGRPDGASSDQAFMLTPDSLSAEVPLPAGAALLPAALAGFGLLRRRRTT